MRIVLITDKACPPAFSPYSDLDEQAVSASALAAVLASLGNRVTLFTRNDSAAHRGSAILAPGVKVEYLEAGPPEPLSEQETVQHLREFGDQLTRRCGRASPDVVHATSWTSGLAALSAARDLGMPVVQAFGSLAATERRCRIPERGSRGRSRLEAYLARSASAVLAASTEEVADLSLQGVPRSSVTVVPPGVDTGHFAPEGPQAPRNGRPRMLAIGPLTERQGYDTLIQVLAHIPEAELMIVGGPAGDRLRRSKLYGDLHKLAARAEAGDRVIITGHVGYSELPSIIRSADVFVSAALHVPLGTAAIQAMACGKPVAAMAVGSHRDAVVDGTTGVLVPPGRPDLLARRLRQLLSMPMRLEALGIAAADRARARYTWQRIGRETLSVYGRCRQQTAAAAPPARRHARPAAAVAPAHG
jgi:D-inositol-3-phosphate glycosyltransferase